MNKLLKKGDKHIIDIIKGGGVAFLFYGLNLVLVYFIAVFISKYYGAEAYGRYSIIKSLILILIILATLGLNTLAIKLSSNPSHFSNNLFNSDYLKKSYFVLAITSTSISGIIFFFKETIATIIFKDSQLEPYLTIFPFLLIAAIFLNYNSNVFKGQGKVLLFSIVSSFLNNFLLLLFILIVYNWYSKDEFFLIIVFFISILIAFLSSLYYVFPLKYSLKIKKKLKIKKLLLISLPMMISSSMIYIIFSIDILMIGFFETSENVGVYRIVTQIASLNTIFVIAFGTILGPKVSKLYSEKKENELKKTIVNASKLIFFVTFPVLIMILLFSNEILLFFGNNYLKGYTALIILAICQFFFAVTGFVDLILNMTNRQKIFGKITVATAVINLILNLFLIPRYGILGAAIATGFSIILTNFLALIYISKSLGVLSIYLPFYSDKINKP